MQLHLVAESCTICSSCSRRQVRKLLDISSYMLDWNDSEWWELWRMRKEAVVVYFKMWSEHLLVISAITTKISGFIVGLQVDNRTRNLPNTKDYITFRDELPLVLRSWSLREPSALKIDSSIIRVQIVVVDFVYQNRKQSSFP